MHYYTQQQLFTAARLMKEEVDKPKPDMLGILELLTECTEIIDREILALMERILQDEARVMKANG